MATAEGGGPSSNINNISSPYGGGGAGGKFRKKPLRKQPTPYDRPPTTYRGTNNTGTTSGWMTKLFLDPASKLISYGANRFFESLFRKRLPAPPPEVNKDTGEGAQGAFPNNHESGQEPAGGESSVPTNSRSSGVCELEKLLKQKTFSRSEIDHLTKLLQSRAIEVSAMDDGQNNEVNALDVSRQEQFASGPMQENRNGGVRTSTDMSAHVLNSNDPEDDITTPAEVAKAYMGSRPSKGLSSMLGMRHQGSREDMGLLGDRPFVPKMPVTSLTGKTSVTLATPENGFITPRPRGRSAIYSMARAPYSRGVHPTSVFKGRSNTIGSTGPSMSPSTFSRVDNEDKIESLPMTLKRRSSVLDDDVGSIASVRRTRQKSNLLALKNSETTPRNSTMKQNLQLIGEPSHKALQAVGETESESVPIASRNRVPSKSSEVAARIFAHLEKLTPKEKSSESKLVAIRERSPIKLTSGMLSGQGLKSVEKENSPKFLMDGLHHPNTNDFSSQKPRNVEENGPKELVAPSGMWNPVIKNDSSGSIKASSMVTMKTTDFAIENGAPNPPPKRRAFRMSAQEDFLEQDDEVQSNGLIPTLSSEKMGAAAALLKDSKPAPAEVSKSVKTSIPAPEEATLALSSVATPFSVATSKEPVRSSSPVFSFSSKVADKFPALPSESNEITETRVESSSSLLNVSASTESQGKRSELDKSGHQSPPKAGDINRKSDTLPFAREPHVSSSSPVSTTAVFGSVNETSTGSGLMFTSTTSTPNFLSSGINTPATSVGNIFGLAAKPSTTAGPNFKFGASVDPATAVPASSASKNSEMPEGRTNEGQMNPSSGGVSVPNTSIAATPPANPESTTSELGASVSHSTVFHGSPFGSASKSVVFNTGIVSQGTSLPVVPSTSSPGTVPQGMSALPVSSASSTLFNMNGSTGGSALSNPQVLNPSNAFGPGSSASSLDTTTVTPGSGPTSSVFKFGASPISEGNVVSTSSASTPFIFSFGSGASTSSTSTNSAALPKFNLGDKSLVPDGSGSTAASGLFKFGGNSSTSSAVNTISSNTAATVFSSSWPSPTTSIFGSNSTLSQPTGFSIGASSTSSAVATSAPMLFNSSGGTSSSSIFSFAAAAPASSSQSLPTNQPVFGATPISSFGATPSGTFGASPSGTFGLPTWNNNQVNSEDSMAEDPVQLSAPAAPVFGQPTVSPSPGFTFGGSTVPQPNPFMFGNQQNQGVPQNPAPSPSPSPFQATGSLDFNAGGSFSLGTGDKSGRRIVKASRNKNRKR